MSSPAFPRHLLTGAPVPTLARRLMGWTLATRIGGTLTSGRIVETEAYGGQPDRASHAWNQRRTARTEPMFGPPGHAYIYLCYGIHHLFNVVVLPEGQAAAVLIRALEPLDGLDTMLRRRRMTSPSPRLTNGPGSLCAALGLTLDHNRADLTNPAVVWLQPPAHPVPTRHIARGSRVGVGYAGPDAFRPWRFALRDSPWVSPARGTAGDLPGVRRNSPVRHKTSHPPPA